MTRVNVSYPSPPWSHFGSHVVTCANAFFFKHQTVDTKSTLISEHEGFLFSLVVYHTQGIERDMSD